MELLFNQGFSGLRLPKPDEGLAKRNCDKIKSPPTLKLRRARSGRCPPKPGEDLARWIYIKSKALLR